MKFGVREICDVVFKAKGSGNLGSMPYNAGQPVLYIDSAKASTMESSSTTVYAQGGKGNARLIAWEGEKTLTFTVEDALLSPIGFAILSGAGLLTATQEVTTVKVHYTSKAHMDAKGVIDLSDALEGNEEICGVAPVFVMVRDADDSLTGEMLDGFTITNEGKSLSKEGVTEAKDVFVDFYVAKDIANVHDLTIDAGSFAGNWYVEASTLFRRQADGKDLPAEITFPNVKIQSNFTFSMAATGDPSTFTFTMDALPGKVQGTDKNVLCAIQIVEDEIVKEAGSATGHDSLAD